MNPMKTLMGALPIVAAAFGRKFGVKVQVGGAGAWTNGDVINIPEIDETPDAATLAWGYLTHEAAHVRGTDIDLFEELASEGPVVKTIANILEDVRIENAIIQPYPGTRKTLDAVMQWMAEHGMMTPPKVGDPPAKVLVSTLLLMGRHRYRKQGCLAPAAQEAERVLREVFPQAFVYRFLGALTEIQGLKSTQEVAAKARELWGLIKEESEKPPPPPPDQDQGTGQDQSQGQQDQGTGQDQSQGQQGQDAGQDQSQGQQGQDAGQDQSQGQQDQGTGQDQPQGQQDQGTGQDQSQGQQDQGTGQDQSQGQQDQGTGQDQSEGQQDQGTGQDQPQGQQDQGTGQDQSQGQQGQGANGADALRAVLDADLDDLPGDAFEDLAEMLTGYAKPYSGASLPSLEDYDGNPEQGLLALKRVRGESAKLTARLQGLVQASQMTATRTVRRGTRLDPTKLYRVGVKDDRVFARQDKKAAPNTAIFLLVDLSGSMCSRSRVALDATMALAMALEPIRGVSCAAVAFPGTDGSDDKVTHLLSRGERVTRAAGAFFQGARGNTPMTEALWYAAAELCACREERKVILVMTDGDPDDTESAKDMVTKATAAGIEVIGVGIGVNVARVFPVSIRIGSVADLKRQLFGIAEKLLLR